MVYNMLVVLFLFLLYDDLCQSVTLAKIQFLFFTMMLVRVIQ